ncbi:hypothetical protein HK105_203005 [Polyrhizophydium stewartii]|uniref:Uncharacterized protein n=1 Tax=Polyrhizophydium stewartii TaxID=2732419 RepID=A0ABR4ND20_9FUNG|nr:hypothetical protein HK105_006500 [Polyrhizophydium stewartii]
MHPFVDQLLGALPEGMRVPLSAALSSTQSMAFTLAFVASMGTFLGGLLVVAGVKLTRADPTSPRTKRLMGVLQSFSGGVMLYITCFDLVPEAIEVLGSQETMLWVFAGVLVFGLLEKLLDDGHDHGDHDHGHQHGGDEHEHGHGHAAAAAASDDEPAVSPTASPGTARKSPTRRRKQPQAAATAKRPASPARGPKGVSEREKRDLMRTSLITFVALAMHNLPEGLGVYLSAMSDMRLGVQLAVAIMLHNIPEGMAVAIPLYAATASTAQVLWWTLVNGLAEPLGVVVGGLALQAYLTPMVLSRCLAAVGGIMLCISIHELQPTAIKYAGKTAASVSFFVGMVVCFCALESVNVWFGGHSHSHGSHSHGSHSHGSHSHSHGSHSHDQHHHDHAH